MDILTNEVEKWKEPVLKQVTVKEIKELHVSDSLMSITFTIQESIYPFRIIYEKQSNHVFKEKATDVKFTHYSYPTSCFTHQQKSLTHQLFSHPKVKEKQRFVHPFQKEDFYKRFYK